MRRTTLPMFTLTAALTTTTALAQPDPSGIDFVTITHPGNAPWTGGGENNGRGQVDYQYRIGRLEVTTAQWAEFMNAALDRPSTDRIPHVFAPTQWGAASATPINPGGQRFTVPAGRGMIPTGGVDWRTCAIYCNWLHNNKASTREAFLSGAYDVSTFGYIGEGGGFTDQLTRSPGARYFVPSLDEWMKAAHWSPANPNNNGWYLYSNGTDTPYTYAPPPSMGGNGTANGVWRVGQFPEISPFLVSLGAYTSVMSPWGLFDVAGGTTEWTEAFFQIPDEPVPRERYLEGSGWNSGSAADFDDHAQSPGAGGFPTFFGFDVGFRVAESIPAPGPSVVISLFVAATCATRRRKQYPGFQSN